MKNILVPVGNTEKAVSTLQYAVDFANAVNANIFVMRAYTLLPRAGAISNVDNVMQRSAKDELEAVVRKVDQKEVDIKVVTYKGDVLDGVRGFEKQYDIDLIIVRPCCTDNRSEVYLGSTSGSIVKQTETPVLVVPTDQVFSPAKTMLAAFKSGRLKKKKSKIAVLKEFKDHFGTAVKLLLVKTPGYEEKDLKISGALMEISSSVTITENATTYQAVLEHFQSTQPDILCVFRRKRGFFEKLWESNAVLKKDFYATIPLLVLKGEI